MNGFRTMRVRKGFFYRIFVLLAVVLMSAESATGRATESQLDGHVEVRRTSIFPMFREGETILADIDALNQRVLVLLEDGLWEYSLEQNQWKFLDSLHTLSEKLKDLEFGYNSHSQKLLLWSRGLGQVFEVNTDTYEVQRVDQSHPHKNQFGHQPFFHNGSLYAFGGYGYWQWKNILIFFNRDIKEWNIHNVAVSSPIPDPRVPKTGVYVASNPAFYTFGGFRPKASQRADDRNTERVNVKDIWKFSFSDESWEKLSVLPDSDLEFFPPAKLDRIGRTNAITKSFYSASSGLWYLPMMPKDKPYDTYYLWLIKLPSGRVYDTIELGLGKYKEFLPTNFLFDGETESVVVIGVDYLSNSDTYPVRVVRIAEDSLLSQIQSSANITNSSLLYYFLGFLIAGSALVFLFWKKSRQAQSDSQTFPIHPTELEQLEWLNDQEKILIKKLLIASRSLESQELEELIWPEIDSFDYRRKLRNDTIRSINNKFISRFPDQSELVIRKKDPNDSRRYIYSINELLVTSEDVRHNDLI